MMSRNRDHMNKEQIDVLLEIYRYEECLWNTNHPSYYNKEIRTQAYNTIIEAIEETFGITYTVDYINSKIQNLRTYYCRETRKKYLAQEKGGDYQCHWSYYDVLDSFLRDHAIPKGVSRTNNDTQNGDCTNNETDDGGMLTESRDINDGQEIKLENASIEGKIIKRKLPSPSETLCKPKQSQNQINQGISSLKKVRSTSDSCILDCKCMEDEDMVFARYLAFEMKKVKDQRTKQLMKLKLQTIIFEAQVGPEEVE